MIQNAQPHTGSSHSCSVFVHGTPGFFESGQCRILAMDDLVITWGDFRQRRSYNWNDPLTVDEAWSLAGQ